ncbi:hypothetical protein PI124_g24236 [Phytophthora idaei]|nr:hypothetical protein PI125_g26226 [Phytophthora idaei]KAG3122310.1 hypothetical protein PI126_g24202 [Phytophthora idaei]KAG3230667.1 hypothetical protein PI124_g24236 [Phytophthora idaei]
MIHVSPRDMQRFYMRVLLIHRKGPTSFENLRTVDGVTYDSYREAALHAGYLEDDSEWVACMTEVSQFRMPYQLRQLFATIIVYSQVVEVGALWERFYDDLSLDFGYKYRSLEGNAKEEMVKFHTLKSLNDLLLANGSVAHFEDLPSCLSIRTWCWIRYCRTISFAAKWKGTTMMYSKKRLTKNICLMMNSDLFTARSLRL